MVSIVDVVPRDYILRAKNLTTVPNTKSLGPIWPRSSWYGFKAHGLNLTLNDGEWDRGGN